MMGFGGYTGKYGQISMMPYEVRRRLTSACYSGHHDRCGGGNNAQHPCPCPCPCHGPEEATAA